MQEQHETNGGQPSSVAYRCSCGANVLLPAGGRGNCDICGRNISLAALDTIHTVSFCAEVDEDTSFQLSDGVDRSGERLGHFRLMSKLGYGGMGAVYRALDESLQRFVAVKVIRSGDEGSDASKLVNRLLDEAVAQARLNHPNVITIYYVGRDGEEPFFAMELLPGPTLAQVIEENGLAYADVVHYARQIVSALAQANRLGLVHGDIKPGNLILAGDRTVKLGDFGLAKTERSGPRAGISGTLNYMAPELANGEISSAQSDMYSLGVTLFEMTFGRRPFPIFGTTLKEQLHSHRAAEVEYPEKWPVGIPQQWQQVLNRLLQSDPARRYATYEELDADLRQLEPVGVTNAGLLSRGLALVTDYAVLGVLLIPFALPGQLAAQAAFYDIPTYLRDFTDRFGMLSVLAPVVPLAAAWAEWHGWRTLGRYLFQLRLVDDHGLPLDRRKRVMRSLIRYAPIWSWSFSLAALALGFDLAAVLLAPVDKLIFLLDTIPVLGPRKLALHDRLTGSRIVLDTDQ